MAHDATADLEEWPVLDGLRATAGGTTAQALGGTAAVVLAVLGLAGLVPLYLGPVAVILLGAALLFEGHAAVPRLIDLWEQVSDGEADLEELGSGLSGELLGGAAGVVLGVLALLHVVPGVLVPVAIIVLGTARTLSTSGLPRIGKPNPATGDTDETQALVRQVARSARTGAIAAQILVGLGAVALGILALAGVAPATLSLAALIALGAATSTNGSPIADRCRALVRGDR